MGAPAMVLRNGERSRILELLDDVKPYMAEIDSVDKLARRFLELADSTDDFLRIMQNEHDTIKDSVLRTDLRIYMSRIRNRTKTHPL